MTVHVSLTPMRSDQAKELGYVFNTSADSYILSGTFGLQWKINYKNSNETLPNQVNYFAWFRTILLPNQNHVIA